MRFNQIQTQCDLYDYITKLGSGSIFAGRSKYFRSLKKWEIIIKYSEKFNELPIPKRALFEFCALCYYPNTLIFNNCEGCIIAYEEGFKGCAKISYINNAYETNGRKTFIKNCKKYYNWLLRFYIKEGKISDYESKLVQNYVL